MAGRARLPGDCGLPGLLHQAAETGFRGPEQLGFSALDQRGQQHVQLLLLASSAQDPLDDRIGGLRRDGLGRFAVAVGREQGQMLRMVVQPGGGDAQGLGQTVEHGSGGVQLAAFDRIQRSGRKADLLCQHRHRLLPGQAPCLDIDPQSHGGMILD